MSSPQVLRNDARRGATWRGHVMTRFRAYATGRWESYCRECGMEVNVKTRPAPNEVNISGEAVALNCEGKG